MEKEPIILVEGGVGREILPDTSFGLTLGSYQTGPSGEHTGVFVGLRLDSLSVGVGADFHLLSLLFGPFSPAQTDNPWFQGPEGPW